MDPDRKRDYDGVAWVYLDLLLTALRDPRFGERSPTDEEAQWPLERRREDEAKVAALIAAARRLGPLLERNAPVIVEGSKVAWW